MTRYVRNLTLFVGIALVVVLATLFVGVAVAHPAAARPFAVKVTADPPVPAVGEISRVTALVTDAKDDPIPDQTVYFTTGEFSALLSGGNEVPPVLTRASGRASFTYNPATRALSYRVDVSRIISITMAHIHRGSADVAGPIAYWLYDSTGTRGPDGPFDPDHPISGTVTLRADDEVRLFTRELYVNVHTAARPGGEIRGQIGGGMTRVTNAAGKASILLTRNEPGPVTVTAIADGLSDSTTLTFVVPTVMEMRANEADTGYFDSRQMLANSLGSGYIWAGVDNRAQTPRILYGGTQFDIMGTLPEGARIVSATLELTGRSDSYLERNVVGLWQAELLPANLDSIWRTSNYFQIHTAPAVGSLVPVLRNDALAPGRVNVFRFLPANFSLLKSRMATTGKVSFRISGTTTAPYVREIFGWDGRSSAAPVLRITYVH